jgi:hypothetical protein
LTDFVAEEQRSQPHPEANLVFSSVGFPSFRLPGDRVETAARRQSLRDTIYGQELSDTGHLNKNTISSSRRAILQPTRIRGHEFRPQSLVKGPTMTLRLVRTVQVKPVFRLKRSFFLTVAASCVLWAVFIEAIWHLVRTR